MIHHADKALDQIITVAERPRLFTFSVDSDIMTLKSLHDKVRDHAAIVRAHIRTVSVKNTDYPNIHLVLTVIIKKYGLRLFDIEHLTTHGGSNRYYICKENAKYKESLRLKSALKKEIAYKLHRIESYYKFSKRVNLSRKKLFNLIMKLKKKHKKIISYGATYKSTTVFNFCRINSQMIDYVTDTTLNKQGKYTPGTHLKIISPNEGMNDNVDYAFLGAWNFKKEIFKKEKNFLKRGGRFITHVPKVMTISR